MLKGMAIILILPHTKKEINRDKESYKYRLKQIISVEA